MTVHGFVETGIMRDLESDFADVGALGDEVVEEVRVHGNIFHGSTTDVEAPQRGDRKVHNRQRGRSALPPQESKIWEEGSSERGVERR